MHTAYADLRVATSDTSFWLLETQWGIAAIPAAWFPKIMPWAIASELLLLAERMARRLAELSPVAVQGMRESMVLDIPLCHKDAAYVRSHFDGMEVRVNDAPRANEILVAVAVADSGRPLPRVGGLTHDEAEGKDGLR